MKSKKSNGHNLKVKPSEAKKYVTKSELKRIMAQDKQADIKLIEKIIKKHAHSKA